MSAQPEVTRLTATQYRNAIEQLFGDGLTLPDLPEDEREEHFRSVAAGRLGLSSSVADVYAEAAQSVAGQVFASADRRARVVGCAPVAGEGRACAAAFLRGLLRRAWRRPPEETALAPFIDGAAARERSGGFWQGLEHATAAVLMSPRFLFRVDDVEPDPEAPAFRFDGYAMASRLAFLLTDRPPDDALLERAGRGELGTAAGVRAAFLAYPQRARHGVIERFLSELFDVVVMHRMSKDERAFPMTNAQYGEHVARSTELFLADVVENQNGSLRSLLGSRDVFVNERLLPIYDLDLAAYNAGSKSKWRKMTLPAARLATGLLGQAAFLGFHSGQVHTSPIHRGLAIRRTLLCEDIPEPPGDVDMTLPRPPEGVVWTTRERSERMLANATCGGCHQKMDPLGWAFEGFDAAGLQRNLEAGKPVATGTSFDGRPVKNGAELAAALLADPRFPPCLVKQLARFSTGRKEFPVDDPWLDTLTRQLRERDLALNSILLDVVSSDLFRRPRVER